MTEQERTETPSPEPSPSAASIENVDKKWRRRSRILWLEWVKPLLIIGLVMFSFRSAVADWNDVPTGSMKPTIIEGDRIFINKVAYDLKFPFTRWRLAQWDDPKWGDVVVLRSPEDSKRLVKRVVGLPGDFIEISGTYLFRNGDPAVYSRLPDEAFHRVQGRSGLRFLFYNEDVDGREHPIMVTHGSRLQPDRIPDGCLTESPEKLDQLRVRGDSWYCSIGEGQFFVMGDNRNNSRDSRFFGPVDRSAVLGEATAVALSFDRENYFKPRFERFFSDLP